MNKALQTLLFLIIGACALTAQTKISGIVADDDGPLIGATVIIQGTNNGTITDFDGRYELAVQPGIHTVEVGYVGYGTSTQSVTVGSGEEASIDFILLQSGIAIDEIVVIGTRAANRTNTNSAVPVDVINVSKLAVAAPQTTVNEILTYSAPSFSSNTQTISDGTDHIDPASLRGLGPDQVLVLMNGKRRHNTSLVNVNGTFGRGNVGTDMNTIPASAIGNLQVLRDGASAQYGSDAIAGVINVQLKESTNELALNLTTGGNFTDGDKIGPFEGEDRSIDGQKVTLGVNYGLPLGEKGGFVNMTGEFDYRAATNRMREFTGGIFNAMNGIERTAVAQTPGIDVTTLSNDQIRDIAAGGVGYDDALYNQIANASDMDIAGLLGTDVTDAELAARGQVRSDYNMRVGQSEGRGGKFFANMGLPVGENLEFYSFGGASYRNGESGCFYRLPSQNRTTTSIYPNGTVPKINSNITDRSIAAGIKGTVGNWYIDFSNTYGKNNFQYKITDSHNATLGTASPTEFDAGGHSFSQNTSNFDITQYFDNVEGVAGLNVAFGAEYRYENYNLNPGTEVSYGDYDVNGNIINQNTTPQEFITTDALGRRRPSGAQCFAGFLPANQTDSRRSSVATYADVELDITESFLVGGALRYENFSDFGSTFNYKAVTRIGLSDNVNVRAAYSTGFRAPSLHQISFSRVSTIFENINGESVAQEVGVYANNSRAATLLGIPQLKEETSNSISAGFTARVPSANLSVTLDGYIVNIDDRVVLTGQFRPGDDEELQMIFESSGATRAAFFANAIGTQSKGLDLVLSNTLRFGEGLRLSNDFAMTLSKTTVDRDDNGKFEINASPFLEEKGLIETYFDETSRIYLEEAVPRVKFILSNGFDVGNLNVFLRNTYFGETTEATNTVENQTVYGGKVITDLSFGYGINDNLTFTIGSNNLFDIYPDETIGGNNSSGRFLYSRRSPQFGTNGRHLFARLSFTLK